MAAHHHFHQHCHRQPITPIPISAAATTTTTTSCYCCCTTTTYTPSHYPSPTEPVLEPMASHIPPPPSQPPCLRYPHAHPSYNTHNLHSQCHLPQAHHQKQHSFRHHYEQEQEQIHPIISSLLRRIAALESSVRNHSASHSFRDAAARTIQNHFRAFLVRRSRTLRHLKELAFIKSAVNTLKSSSDKTHFDPQSLSHKAMDLLLKVDSIEGGDPMIRDGKRSISRELIWFIEFVDGISVKKHDLSSRAVKNARLDGHVNKSRVFYGDHKMHPPNSGLGRDKRELMEKIRCRFENSNGISRTSEESDAEDEELENAILSTHGKYGLSLHRNGGLGREHGGVQAKVKKSVSFAENGNVYRLISPRHVRDTRDDCNSIDGGDSVDGEREILDNICKAVEDVRVSSKETEDRDESQTEDEQSPKISNGGRVGRKGQKTERNCELQRHDLGENGGFLFSAPLPVKMESRADLTNKRKTLQVVE